MLKSLSLSHTQINDAGCSTMALAIANDDALPALEQLKLHAIPACPSSKMYVSGVHNVVRSYKELMRNVHPRG
jgi:hypothetical protein